MYEKKFMTPSNFIKIFCKKFDNLIGKSPTAISYEITPSNTVVLTMDSNPEPYRYKLNFDKTIEGNIYEIRQKLIQDYYPKFSVTRTEEVKLSEDEIENLIVNEGWAVDKALESKKFVPQTKNYVITRVIPFRNEAFLRDLNSNSEDKFRIKNIPFFLSLLRKKEFERAENFFKEKSQYAEHIYSEQEWEKIKKTRESNSEYGEGKKYN